jgi:hypothetical protein
MGSRSSQTHVAFPPDSLWLTSRPLAITSRPAGTVTRNVQVALSLGWSLSGIHVDVAFGSSPMKAPSLVWMKP